jgi:hypothetical protein
MIRGRFFITPHAVHRFIERYYHGRSFEEARERLIELCEHATFVKKGYKSKKMYRLPRHGCSRARIIVADAKVKGDADVVMTVL